MYAIDPGEPWGAAIIIGGSQSAEYEPLYARLNPGGQTITRWRLTDDERQKLAAGADLFCSILQFGHPLQPMALFVGEPGDG